METNNKVIRCDIQLPHNVNLEQILSTLKGWEVEFWDKRKSGILKVELTKVEEMTDLNDERYNIADMPNSTGSPNN